MRYNDGADEDDTNETHGFVFYYPSINMCKVIDCQVDSASRVKDL